MKEHPYSNFINYWIDIGWKTPHTYDKHFSQLPHDSGVYFFLLANFDPLVENPKLPKILYIGQSGCLYKRHTNHEVKSIIKSQISDNYDFLQLWFKELPYDLIKSEEKKLISTYNPPFNLVHRTRSLHG